MSTKLRLHAILSLLILASVAFFTSDAARAADPSPADSTAGPSAPSNVEAPDSSTAPSDGSGLFLPKPIPLCRTGMCGTDSQCEDWFGPGSTCDLGAGQTCGFCAV